MTTDHAAEVGRLRDLVADAVTDALLSRHPERPELQGDRARSQGVEDARHHIDFLQASIDLDDPRILTGYARWRRDLLESRGIAVEVLVESLESIRAEFARRLPLPAASSVGTTLGIALEALEAPADPPDEHGTEKLSPAAELYLSAAIDGRRTNALAIVQEAVAAGASPDDVYVDIMQSALYEVGRRWQTTELTVAEEHMATATTQYILSTLHEDLTRGRDLAGTAIVTGVANEPHVVGANIIANALEAGGWDVRFLGSDLPDDSILTAIQHHRPTLVAISMTMSRSIALARDLITQIKEVTATTPRIIVGGSALRHDPQLWRVIGADAYAADVRGVLEVARP